MKKLIILLLLILVLSNSTYAGNEQRSGQAGATELLINPWARSSGFGGANTASIKGLEAIFLNVAGTAFTHRTDLIFSRTTWLVGTEIYINTFGFSQKVGEAGVMSVAVMTMDFGNIEITTVDLPEGGLGTFHPQYTNIALAYAKEFSNSIYGGLVAKVIYEGISDLSASGIAFDAGIQYVTGEMRQLRFGISMKNVGPTIKYKGDGISFRGTVPAGIVMTVEQRSAEYELPSLIKIGVSYDFYLMQHFDSAESKTISEHKLTLAGNFTSNSFSKDQFHFGFEYGYRDILFLRAGYVHEEGINDYETRTTVYTGPTAGVSVQIPLNKEKGSLFSLDYSYRDTDLFAGTHNIGVKISL